MLSNTVISMEICHFEEGHMGYFKHHWNDTYVGQELTLWERENCQRPLLAAVAQPRTHGKWVMIDVYYITSKYNV